jgi:CHAD domain-containing protein
MNIDNNFSISPFTPKITGKTIAKNTVNEPLEVYSSSVKSNYEGAPLYPYLAKKIFSSADRMEELIGKLGDNPTPEAIHETKVRDIVRGLQGLTKAYGDCYDEKELKGAMENLKKFAYMAGQFKDLSVYEEKIKLISPGGVISEPIQKSLSEFGKEKDKEFKDFYKEFKSDKLPEALEVLRNPSGADEIDPKDIEKEDLNRLKTAVRVIADKITSVGLLHEDPEEFHDGRKTLRNLVQMMNETGDIFSYKEDDVKALKHLFKSCGKSQDLHITQVWLEENGFNNEAEKIAVLQKEAQANAMTEAKTFLSSGVIDSIKNSL